MKPQSIVGIRPKSSPFNAAVAGAKEGARKRAEQGGNPASVGHEQKQGAQERARDHPQRCEQVPIKGNAGRKVILHAHAHPKH